MWGSGFRDQVSEGFEEGVRVWITAMTLKRKVKKSNVGMSFFVLLPRLQESHFKGSLGSNSFRTVLRQGSGTSARVLHSSFFVLLFS
jgi:hypothetical protein